jgi:predicted nucleic acid-binding protein
MSLTVLFDSDVLLDVLTHRQPHYDPSAEVWALAEDRLVEGVVSSLAICNVYYILRKSSGESGARTQIRQLLDVFRVLPVDENAINDALASSMTDYEDAVQVEVAAQVDASWIVTRNVRDFRKGSISAQTPADFLSAWRDSNGWPYPEQ